MIKYIRSSDKFFNDPEGTLFFIFYNTILANQDCLFDNDLLGLTIKT